MRQDKRIALLAVGEVGGGGHYLECNNIVEWRSSEERETRQTCINTQVHSEEVNEHSSKWRGKGNKQLPERSALRHGANENGRSRSKFLPKLGP